MKKTIFIVGTAIIGAFLIVTGIASAATLSISAQANVGANVGGSAGGNGHFGMGAGGMRGGMAPGVFGTVSAVNGTTLTVTATNFAGGGFRHGSSTPTTSGATASTTTYTVDASSATVTKNGASSTISSVAVGDKVMVRGTVSGDSVAATAIMDGVPAGGMGPGGMRGGQWMSSSTRPTSTRAMAPAFQGNGEPVVGGTVTAINGSSLTVTNTSNVTYTIDGSSATVLKGNVTSSLSAVSVNDNVLVQGSVSGTSVTATTIIDQGVPRTPQNGSSTASGSGGGKGPGGFVGGVFGGIGSFFQHLFGFF
jgi:hypothetical protein